MVEMSGTVLLRAENVDHIIKNVLLQEMVMMQVVATAKSSADRETYFQETNTDLVASGTTTIEDTPRLSNFHNVDPTFSRKTGWNKKYAAESVVSLEDELMDDIDVISRCILRVTRAIARAIDTRIWNTLTEDQTPSTINSLTIAAGFEWDSATISQRDPIQNILDARRNIKQDNVSLTSNTVYLLLNPKNAANLMGNANIRNAGQFFSSGVTANGHLGQGLGCVWLESNVVTADKAAIIIGQACGSWVEVEPIKTAVVVNEGVSKTIKAWGIGHARLVSPESVCLIENTDA